MALRKIDSAGHELEQGAADSYAAMVAAARLEGVSSPSLSVLSAHRTREKQEELWKAALEKYGTASVAKMHVALPGRSAHEKGIALDLSGPDGRTFLSDKDEAWKWMRGRAADFGWKLDKDIDEPWHWVYVGSWSASWSSIPSWAKWATGGAIALFALWPSDSDEVMI